MLEFIVKYSIMIFSSMYIFYKITNKSFKTADFFVNISVSVLSSFACYYICLVIPYINVFITSGITFLLLLIIHKRPIQTTLPATIISLAIAYAIYYATVVVSFPILLAVFFLIKDEAIRVFFGQAIVVILQFIAIRYIMRLKRFKNFFYITNVTFKNTATIVMSLIILLLSSFFNIMDLDVNLTAIFLIIFITIAIVLVFSFMNVWWRKSIKLTYMEKVALRNEEISKNLHESILEENMQLKAEVMGFSKIIQKDNEVIPALKFATVECLKIEDREKSIIKTQELIKSITQLEDERKSELKKHEKEAGELPTTDIYSIDSCIKHLYGKALESNIKLYVSVVVDLRDFVDKVISEQNFNTILLDLGENAIIASKENKNNNILITFNKQNGSFCLNIYDGGGEFSPKIISNIGMSRMTTHKNEGGSGIGLMTVIEIIKKHKASFVINELDDQLYTKNVSICFDGEEQIRVHSHRVDVLKLSRERNDIVFLAN